MEIAVKGKNIEITPALASYAEKKVAKIGKFFPQEEISAEVNLAVEREQHIAEVTVLLDGLLLRGEEKSGDMYASIDGVVDKLERQIHKYKTRLIRRLRGERPVTVAGPRGGKIGPEAAEEREEPARIVRSKRFPIKPMPLEEAILQMELLDHDFFVFINAETEEVNVVYKRRKGQYGLLEPER